MKINALPSVELQGCAIKKLESKRFKEQKTRLKIQCSKLLKYLKDLELQLVIELFLNLPPLHTMQTHNLNAHCAI
jgi:hypothetical protein